MDDPPEPWRPRSHRDDPSYEETLYEGIPEHLQPSLQFWLFDEGLRAAGGEGPGALRLIERRLRCANLPTIHDLWARMVGDPEFGLDVVDLLVVTAYQRGEEADRVEERNWIVAVVVRLVRLLDEAGSAWTVGVAGGRFRLVRRVDETVQARAEAEFAVGGSAAEHLAAAWGHLYGRHPDHDRALDEANKALEAAAKPVVSPTNQRTTLGTVIANLRDAPTKWTTALGDVAQLAARLELIWRVQRRHGDDTARRSVDPAAATAAIHDAIALVHWFRTGLVVPSS